MSEIVHDIAPGAKIIFSTGGPSKAAFGDNILALRAAGAQIIVDDLTYGGEWQFQDDEIGQAVNQVVASGALYFSAAGNEGNFRAGTSRVWEGDFVNGGTNALLPGGTVHSYGAQTYNRVSANSYVSLQWSDEYTTSANDYDLYVLSADGTSVVNASTNIQDGNDAPFEEIFAAQPDERIVIFKSGTAASRYLRLFAGESPLAIATPGEIIGHSANFNAIAVGGASATDAVNTPPGYFTTASQGEPFSSDGPRKMFYFEDGTPITPGNFLASGGQTLQQPILTAGDCGVTSVPGFAPFCGTSASAPAAAAITALVWSTNLTRTNTQVRAILEASLLDIQDPGFDVNTGKGILMADLALANAVPPGTIIIRKATSPTGGTGFGFTSNVPGTTSFTLNDGENRTINSVVPGSYTVSENAPSGYSLTGLSCTDPTNNSTVNVGTRTATINVAAGETVDCTFTNTQIAPPAGALDTFNRANGSVGSNWEGLTGSVFYRIAGNKLDVQLGGPIVWKPSSFGTSQEAFVTLSTIDSGSRSQGLLLKVQTGSIPNSGAISVVYDARARAVRVSALRLGRNGNWTLYPSTAATFANGDRLGARVLASGTVEIYKNGTLVTTATLTATDQAFFNAKGGKIGIWTVAAPNALLDDFGGGTLLP